MTGAPLFTRALLATLLASCVVPVGKLHESDSPFIHAGPLRSWDALDYQLALQLEEDVGRLRGVVRVEFEILTPTHLILLDAVDLTIEKVTAGGSSPSWVYDGQILKVEFSDWLRPGDKGWLEISYSTTPAAGFFFETPGVTGVDQPAHVYTQGECEDARRWFPCNDSPADRATHSLAVIIPASWTSVAAGRQTKVELLENGRKIVHWRLDYPMPPYLFTFAAGEFFTLQDSAAGVPLYFLAEPGDEIAAMATFARTGAILEFFSGYTDFPYPFSKYAQTIVRGFPFGAMENVSATTAGRPMLSADQISRPTWPTVAHELAHQWFGDIVTCSSWPHIWLNEGFATYFTLLYGRHSEGEEDFLWQMGSTVDSYLAACSGDHRRALVKKEYRAPMDLFFDGTVYPGGASRLQLLRGWAGEEVFRAAVARYLRANAWTSVESDALRHAFEREGAPDMGLFFRQWVQGVGYPELRLSWSAEGDQLQVGVEQEHPAADPGGNPLSQAATPWAFRFPLDLRWQSLAGDWKEQRVWVSRRSQSFSLAAPGGVDFLVFDPWVYLPARLHVEEPNSATLARLVQGDLPRDRQLALRRLLFLNILPGSNVLAEVLADTSAHPSLRAEVLRAVPNLARRPRQLDDGLNPFDQAQVRLVLQQPDHPDFLSLEADLLATSAAPATLRAIAIRTAGKRISEKDLPGFLRPWLLDLSSPSPERRAALDVVVDRLPDSRTLALLTNLASRGRPWAVRADAIVHLFPYLDDFPSTRMVVARAMMSSGVPLRRAATSVAVKRPKMFAKAMTARLQVEPNSGIRRQLEQGLKALD